MRWGFLHVIVFTSLAALGAGLYVAAEAVAGHAAERTGALAVGLPVAGFLIGLVTLMLATHHAVRAGSIVPKVAGALVVVLVALVASVPVTVIVAAVVMVTMVVLMVLAGPPPASPRTTRHRLTPVTGVRTAPRHPAAGRLRTPRMPSGPEWFIVLAVVLVIFGGSQLPKLARNLGQAQREFKDGLAEREARRPAGSLTLAAGHVSAPAHRGTPHRP